MLAASAFQNGDHGRMRRVEPEDGRGAVQEPVDIAVVPSSPGPCLGCARQFPVDSYSTHATTFLPLHTRHASGSPEETSNPLPLHATHGGRFGPGKNAAMTCLVTSSA